MNPEKQARIKARADAYMTHDLNWRLWQKEVKHRDTLAIIGGYAEGITVYLKFLLRKHKR